jgi:hypothetical protein
LRFQHYDHQFKDKFANFSDDSCLKDIGEGFMIIYQACERHETQLQNFALIPACRRKEIIDQ